MGYGLMDSALNENRIIKQEEFKEVHGHKALAIEDLTGNENSEYFHRRGNLDVMLSGNK